MHYWLFKSEPGTFSIDDLRQCPGKKTCWDGVRNYQARNFLRDEIQTGDQAFFYHSGCEQPGIAGIVDIVKAGYPDTTALDPGSDHHDPGATPENPRWYMVDVRFREKFARTIPLSELKTRQGLEQMQVARKGNRLSITPVSKQEWEIILKMAGE